MHIDFKKMAGVITSNGSLPKDPEKRKKRILAERRLAKQKGFLATQLHEWSHPVIYFRQYCINADLMPNRQDVLLKDIGEKGAYGSRKNVLYGPLIQGSLNWGIAKAGYNLAELLHSLDWSELGISAFAISMAMEGMVYAGVGWNLAIKLPRSYGMHIADEGFPIQFDKAHEKATFSLGWLPPIQWGVDYAFKRDGPLGKIPGFNKYRDKSLNAYKVWRGDNSLAKALVMKSWNGMKSIDAKFDDICTDVYFDMKQPIKTIKETYNILMDMTPSSLDDVFDDKPYKHD